MTIDRNINKMLRLIREEVERNYRVADKLAEEDQPRDPKTGQWINVRDEEKDKDFDEERDKSPFFEDEPIKGHTRLRKALVMTPKPPKPAPVIPKTPQDLSSTAREVKRQVDHQIAAHGKRTVEEPWSATRALHAYKMNSRQAPAALLKYAVHRIENVDKYKTPAGARSADLDFKVKHHYSLPGIKREKQWPVEKMHNILSQNPGMLDALMDHQEALHQHLIRNGKTTEINGEPHIALSRGLSGAVYHRKDPVLSSYADSHFKFKSGPEDWTNYSHWVPLKNVWYSYDLGPRNAVSLPRRPAQDEFLVSPHDLKDAAPEDVKQLVPRHAHSYDVVHLDQKPGPAPFKQRMTASDTPPSLMRMMKSIGLGLTLRKSDQFDKIDPKFLNMKNEAGFMEQKDRELAKKQITNAGKLNPRDIDKLIQNRNVHLNSLLFERGDLSDKQKIAAVMHPEDFATSGGAERNRATDAYSKIYTKSNSVPDMADKVTKEGSGDVVGRMLSHAPHMIKGPHLMDMVMGRKDLPESTMLQVIKHKAFDRGHITEIRHNPHSRVVVEALRNHDEVPDTVYDAALQDPRPEVRSGLLNRGHYSRRDMLSEAQVTRGLNDEHPEVREAAATNASTPATAKHILDHRLNDPNASKILDNMLSARDVRNYHGGESEQKDYLDPDDLRRVVDYGLAKDKRILADQHLHVRSAVPADSVMKIMQMKDEKPKKNQEYRDETPQGIKAQWMSHPSVTPAHIDEAMANSSHPTVLQSISKHPGASAEQLRESWKRMPKQAESYNSPLRGWVENDNTPTDVLTEATKLHEIVGNIKALVSHHNLSGANLRAFQMHEKPEIRAMAAKNPNADHDHMRLGLADKDKTVRHEWMSHPGLTPEHLAVAIKDRAPSNRVVAAAHPNLTPQQITDILKKDKDEDVRKAAVSNQNATPEHMRDVLMNDKSEKMRRAVLGHASLTPELIEHVLKHDSSEEIRKAMLRHPNVTPELVRHAALNDPSQENRSMALKHAKADPQLLDDAIMKSPSHALSEILGDSPKLKPEHLEKLYHASVAHHDALPKPVEGHKDAWSVEHNRSEVIDHLKKLIKHPNAPESIREHFIGHAPAHDVTQLIYGHRGEEEKALSGQNLRGIYKRMHELPEIPHGMRGTLSTHKKFKESGLLHDFANSPDEVERATVSEHEELPKELADKLATDENDDVRFNIANRKDLSDGTIEKLMQDRHGPVLEALAENTHANHDANRLQRLYQAAHLPSTAEGAEFEESDPGYAAREAVMDHPNATTALLQQGLHDKSERVQKAAKKALAQHDPDSYNQTLHGAHDIEIHPATEKLKHIKGQVQEAGGSVHKKELPNQAQGLPNQMFDSQGRATPESIDNYLKTLPHQRYNVSYGQWARSQRHDDPDGRLGIEDGVHPQKVVQLNMTGDHMRQIKEQGLFDMFKKMHKMSFSSGHPVDMHTLGWARVDHSQPDHWHIDEIQSDFGQNTIREIEKLKKKNEQEKKNDNPFGSIPLDTAMDHLKKITKIFSGPFKSINHAIHAAVHHVARKEGITSTSMDKVEDQANQSGMDTRTKIQAQPNTEHEDPNALFKPLPGHMLNTYKDQPEKDGYGIKPKKDVMPKTIAPEPEVQFRKLVKSHERLRGLINQLKSTTSGRHTAAPAKEAGGENAPVAKKPKKPKKHIRADTQTEVNLRYEKGK